jgi:hypothetical protein
MRNKAWRILTQMEMEGLIRWHIPKDTQPLLLRGVGVFISDRYDYLLKLKVLESTKR